MTKDTLIKSLKSDLDFLKELHDSNIGKQTYVVANETYVHVGPGWRLNDTEFNVTSPAIGCHATTFDSKINAEKYGMDYNLKDGAGKKVELSIIPAHEFYAAMMEMTQNMIKHLNIESE